MKKRFSGKTVLITGASSGFGAETARHFAQEGAKLILLARRLDRLEELKKELNCECEIIEADVRDLETLTKSLSHLRQKGTPNILINNAGLSRELAKVWETDPEDWDKMLDTNVKGVLNVTKIILPMMLEKQEGHVINIGSTSSHEVYAGGGIYCASKFALKAITDTLRLELLGTPVRASLISPGMAETEFSLVRFNGDENKATNVYKGVTPLTAADVAEAILFIASRPPHVNIADLILFPSCQASAKAIHRNLS
jgi:3-hydroxy acid dehydrogenase / malonic semialdehyde reductase